MSLYLQHLTRISATVLLASLTYQCKPTKAVNTAKSDWITDVNAIRYFGIDFSERQSRKTVGNTGPTTPSLQLQDSQSTPVQVALKVEGSGLKATNALSQNGEQLVCNFLKLVQLDNSGDPNAADYFVTWSDKNSFPAKLQVASFQPPRTKGNVDAQLFQDVIARLKTLSQQAAANNCSGVFVTPVSGGTANPGPSADPSSQPASQSGGTGLTQTIAFPDRLQGGTTSADQTSTPGRCIYPNGTNDKYLAGFFHSGPHATSTINLASDANIAAIDFAFTGSDSEQIFWDDDFFLFVRDGANESSPFYLIASSHPVPMNASVSQITYTKSDQDMIFMGDKQYKTEGGRRLHFVMGNISNATFPAFCGSECSAPYDYAFRSANFKFRVDDGRADGQVDPSSLFGQVFADSTKLGGKKNLQFMLTTTSDDASTDCANENFKLQATIHYQEN